MTSALHLRSLLGLALCMACLPLGGAGCPGATGDDGGTPPADGNCIIDGESYLPNLEDSRLLIRVNKKAAGGCGVFHSHVVEAVSYALDCDVDTTDLANATMQLTVSVANLDPDAPDNRALFEDLDGEELGEGDRDIIRGSVAGMLEDTPDGLLTFAIGNVSGLEGADQTLDLTPTINGATSTTQLTFTGAREGENFVWSAGSATLDGTQHDLPNGFGSGCVQSDMPLLLELVLEPGDGPPPEPEVVVPFEPMVMPNDSPCSDDVGYEDIEQILVRRCAGCHGGETDYALVTYDDWNTNSRAYPDRPRWETAEELMALDIAESRHMPPAADASQVPTDEMTDVMAWFAAGAPERCTPVGYPEFTRVDRETECGTIPFGTDPFGDADGLIDNILLFNGCFDCHNGGVAEIPLIDPDSYSSGVEDAQHDFYLPLSLWEASVERIKDGTMPPDYYGWVPVSGDTKDEDVALLEAWIAEGYPNLACP